MKLSDPLKVSYRSLTASKMRFFLTVLGIVIGVAAVILVMAIGASAQALVLSQVEKVGSNLIGILPGASEEDGPPAAALGVVTTTLTYDDLQAMRERRNVPEIVAASGYVTGSATIESPAESFSVTFQGVSPEMADVESVEVASGRFFFSEEESSLARVIVLGASRAKELFPNQDPVGETVKLKNIPFRVVGVLEARGSSAFSSPDDIVFIPLITAQKLILGINYLNFARAKVTSTEALPAATRNIEALLVDRHDIDLESGEAADFSIRTTEQAIGVLTSVTDVLKYFLSGVAGISLLVGGIGIMNSMLISVSQRIREIGLRKAVGARPVHVITQFLIESAFITLIGGSIGIVFGIGTAFLAAMLLQGFGYEWEFLVPPASIAIGFGVSVGIGVLFGLYPAWKAAKVSPMEALRYE